MRMPMSHLGRIILAAVLVIIAIALAWRQIVPSQPAPVRTPKYFYDLDSEMLLIDTNDNVPPFATPSGSVAVAAHVYTCTACTEDEQFIAYLTQYDDATHDALAAMPLEERTHGGADVQQLMQQGQLIRRLDDDQWVALDSEAGMTILQSPPLRCSNPNLPVMVCTPASVD